MTAVPRRCDLKGPACWALQSRASLHQLFCRAHKLEGFGNLFAVRMLVNLARGPVGEFVLVVCRNRIAEHQRVNNPDSTWLHCLPPPPPIVQLSESSAPPPNDASEPQMAC